MLTPRGWWFFLFMILLTVVGMIVENRIGPIFILIGMGLLVWFLAEWFIFALRVHWALPKLRVRRRILADRREAPLVWVNQDFEVCVDVFVESWLGLPYLTFQDRPPSGCDRVSGFDIRTTCLQSDEIAGVRYKLRCSEPGQIRFEGIRVQCADFQGFFYHRTFLRQPLIFTVLPSLTDAEGNRRTTKSHNLLPPPGVHRLRSAGGGSELLDLREYRPGDSPRMIAWKTSARRDKLITKEFESDVPIRCTLFVDTSQSVRIRAGERTMLSQLSVLASAVAQAAASDRDLVGLVLFDEHDVEILPPNRTSRHLIQLLHRLAKAAEAPVVSPSADIDALMALALPLAHELYPELMDRSINRLPWQMFWEPILDYRKNWVFLVMIMPLVLMLGSILGTLFLWGLVYCPDDILRWFAPNGGREAIAEWYIQAVEITAKDEFTYAALGSLGLGLLGFLWWVGHGLSGQFPPWSRIRQQRKRLAAMLAALDSAGPGMEARLLDDDTFFGDRLQRFLGEHHRPYPIQLYDEKGRYLFRSVDKVEILARSLLRSVARGRDNELFVILADLIELDSDLEPLMKAIRVAVARHHQVMVVCPWMKGIPAYEEELGRKQRSKRIRKAARKMGFVDIEIELFHDLVLRYHTGYVRLRRAFGKMGIPLVRAEQKDSIRLILNRMDRLRGVRARR